MRALVVTTSYPVRPGHLGGRFVADLLCGLGEAGWEFDVVLPSWQGASAEPAPNVRLHPASGLADAVSRGLAHGRGIPETLAACPWRWVSSPGLVASLTREASRQLRRRRYALVWSHWLLPGGVAGACVARDRRVPHLATAHGGDVHLLERWSRLPGARALWSRLWARTTLTAPVRHTADRLRRILSGRRVVAAPLPSGARRERGDAVVAGRADVLYLGRLEPVKGPDLLLEACRLLAPRADVALTVAGAGSLEPRLRQAASRASLPVRFAGAVAGDAKRQLLEETTALVVPSRRLADGRSEGFPHAAMEALVQGVPVVAPRRGALGEYLAEHDAGYLYDGEGPDREVAVRLAGALERVLADGVERARVARRAGAAGRPFSDAPARASWDTLLRAVSEVP